MNEGFAGHSQHVANTMDASYAGTSKAGYMDRGWRNSGGTGKEALAREDGAKAYKAGTFTVGRRQRGNDGWSM